MQNDGSLNTNRAICNATAEAEEAETMTSNKKEGAFMQSIYLENYVKVNQRSSSLSFVLFQKI